MSCVSMSESKTCKRLINEHPNACESCISCAVIAKCPELTTDKRVVDSCYRECEYCECWTCVTHLMKRPAEAKWRQEYLCVACVPTCLFCNCVFMENDEDDSSLPADKRDVKEVDKSKSRPSHRCIVCRGRVCDREGCCGRTCDLCQGVYCPTDFVSCISCVTLDEAGLDIGVCWSCHEDERDQAVCRPCYRKFIRHKPVSHPVASDSESNNVCIWMSGSDKVIAHNDLDLLRGYSELSAAIGRAFQGKKRSVCAAQKAES